MGSKGLNEDNNNLNENFSQFPEVTRHGGVSFGNGRFLAFFSKFFGSKKKGRPTLEPPLAGDAQDAKGGDLMPSQDTTGQSSIGVSKGFLKLPKVEHSRRTRYRKYEMMDDYPEIGAACDIYSDDSTLKNEDGTPFVIETDDKIVKDAVEKFIKKIDLETHIWDIARNVVKFGDCFVENIVNLNQSSAGIQRIKVLNPNFIYRVEDTYGYLQKFYQEIPKPGQSSQTPMDSVGVGGTGAGNVLTLDKNQIIHFRRHTSDANYYPYGKSILAPAIAAWNALKMMEDAMLIYRLQRAPERRAFYIETGSIPQSKVENFMERIKQKFKKEKFWNPDTGTIDERYNPLSADEDFFIPTRNGQGTKVETLPGAQNLGDVDDVKYFRDKLLAALKVPKDFIVEKEQSGERKANLSQLDVKFAKTVMRLQRDVESGLRELCRRHLQLKGFPAVMYNNFKVTLYPPSDMFLKRRLETDEQRLRIVQAAKGLMLFPDEYIYKTYFNFSEAEIKEIKEQLKTEAEQLAKTQAELAPPAPPMGGGMTPPGMEGQVPPGEGGEVPPVPGQPAVAAAAPPPPPG
tara:strand:- start:6658 stop:8370 length:1713 start_codon:yes stop_codon:yes gene_type:complete